MFDTWSQAWNWVRSDPDTYRDYDLYCFSPSSSRTHPRHGVALKVKPLKDILQDGCPGRYKTRCPVHEDSESSLSLLITEEGRLIVNCFAGCDWREVQDAIRT